MLFWYDVNGRIVTNLYLAKAYTVWDALAHRRTNAAAVAIQWQAASGDDFIHAGEDALRFADAVAPLLREYLPSGGAAPPTAVSADVTP
jgi:hypothetical protein